MDALIFIGLQASGKSSFYKEKFFTSHVRISLDLLKTRNRERKFFNLCLETQSRLAVDNTNPAVEDRERYIIPLKEAGYAITGYYFASSIQECLERNNHRTGKERIPMNGIMATYNKLVLPEYSEGFDRLYYVSIQNGDFKVEEWKG